MPSLLSLIDVARVPAPAAERVAWLGAWRYAHRGLHGGDARADGVPENSLPAFAAAIAAGLGIECDVRRSRDGRMFVFHDADLDRLTGVAGPFHERYSADLAPLRLAGGACAIPTLADLLALVAGQVPLLIEVKADDDRQARAATVATRRALEGYRGLHAVMSFNPIVPQWFAQRSPHTVRGLVVSERDRRGPFADLRRRRQLWMGRPDFLACDVRDLPSRFAGRQRRRGLPVLAWTVRDADGAAQAAAHADAPIAEGAGIAAIRAAG